LLCSVLLTSMMTHTNIHVYTQRLYWLRPLKIMSERMKRKPYKDIRLKNSLQPAEALGTYISLQDAEALGTSIWPTCNRTCSCRVLYPSNHKCTCSHISSWQLISTFASTISLRCSRPHRSCISQCHYTVDAWICDGRATLLSAMNPFNNHNNDGNDSLQKRPW